MVLILGLLFRKAKYRGGLYVQLLTGALDSSLRCLDLLDVGKLVGTVSVALPDSEPTSFGVKREA